MFIVHVGCAFRRDIILLARLLRNDDMSHVFRIYKNMYVERIDVVNHQSRDSYNPVYKRVRIERKDNRQNNLFDHFSGICARRYVYRSQ